LIKENICRNYERETKRYGTFIPRGSKRIFEKFLRYPI